MSLYVLLGEKARMGAEAKLIRAAFEECARRGGFSGELAAPEFLLGLEQIRDLPQGAFAWILAAPGELQEIRGDLGIESRASNHPLGCISQVGAGSSYGWSTGFLILWLSDWWSRPVENIPDLDPLFKNSLLSAAEDVWAPGGAAGIASLFCGGAAAPDHKGGASVLELPWDPLAIFAAILYRAEEYREGAALDAHGRFDHRESAMFRANLMDRPLADEIAFALGRIFQAVKGISQGNCGENQTGPTDSPLPRRAWRVAVTHDVDALSYWTLRRAVREPSIRSVRGAANSILSAESDPYWTFPRLRGLESELGVRPTVFVIPERRTPDDLYNFADAANAGSRESKFLRELLGWISDGAEAGLHAPYDSVDHPERLAAQRKILADALPGSPVVSCRRHWLRMQIGEIWSSLESAGIENDSTLGFSGVEGFRAGTSHPFRAFDLRAMRPSKIVEVPLIAMDATLRHHRRLSPAEAAERLKLLAARCRQAGGAFTLLWHTHAWRTPDWPGWESVFEGAVKDSLSNGAQSATIREIAHDCRA